MDPLAPAAEGSAHKHAGVVGAEEEMQELECMVALLGGMTFAVVLFGISLCLPCVCTWLVRIAYIANDDPPPMYLAYGWHRASANSSQSRPGRRCAHAWHAEEERRQPILHTQHMHRKLCFMSTTIRHSKSLKSPMMTARPRP
jgi:hypothetical protein